MKRDMRWMLPPDARAAGVLGSVTGSEESFGLLVPNPSFYSFTDAAAEIRPTTETGIINIFNFLDPFRLSLRIFHFCNSQVSSAS